MILQNTVQNPFSCFFYKDRKEIDHKFLSKIAKLDPGKKLQVYFREALAEEFNENDQEKFEKILNTIYR